MVPSTFIKLETLPLTQNGKLDHSQLSLLVNSNALINSSEFVEPRNYIERKLADIWSQLLNIEKVSVKDNFFKLGGDSLLSNQVALKARNIGISLSVKDIFLYPKLADLSRVAYNMVAYKRKYV